MRPWRWHTGYGLSRKLDQTAVEEGWLPFLKSTVAVIAFNSLED